MWRGLEVFLTPFGGSNWHSQSSCQFSLLRLCYKPKWLQNLTFCDFFGIVQTEYSYCIYEGLYKFWYLKNSEYSRMKFHPEIHRLQSNHLRLTGCAQANLPTYITKPKAISTAQSQYHPRSSYGAKTPRWILFAPLSFARSVFNPLQSMSATGNH